MRIGGLRWDPWYQGTRATEPWALVPGHFLFYFIFYFGGSFFFTKKSGKKIVFSLFFLSFSLSFSLSLYTHFGVFLV